MLAIFFLVAFYIQRTDPSNNPAAYLQGIPEDEADEPVVVASALIAWPVWHYAHPSQRDRLIFVGDQTQAAKTHDSAPEMTLLGYKEVGEPPFPIQSPEQFLDTHPSFFVVTNDGLAGEWLPAYLSSRGYVRKPVSSENRFLFLYTRVR